MILISISIGLIEFLLFAKVHAFPHFAKSIDEETGMIHMAVERYCLPNVIDALNEILGGSETDKNE